MLDHGLLWPPVMKRALVLSFLFSMTALTGCERSPKATCESYVKLRKDDWPTGADVEKECVKDLTSLKERSPKAYSCAQKCVEIKAEHIIDCFNVECSTSFPEDDTADIWMFGLGSESSGSWADEKPKKLTTEDCREGAFAISGMKAKLGVIDKKDRGVHRVELFDACKKAKDDPGYAKSFACLRRVTKKDQILGCTQTSSLASPMPMPGGASPNKIEGCVTECTGKHGSEPTPAYMSCFNACKAR